MPQQKPLIDLDQLDRNRGSQLAELDKLAHRLTSGIARDGYSVSVQTMISLMRVFDSLASPQRPETWHGIKAWSAMAGISKEQCGRAISVLKSLNLITARVTWVAFGRRGMKVSINWSTIFTTGPITQAPEDITAWTAKKIRQRNLFAKKRTPRTLDVMTVSETVTMTVSENHTMTVSETGVVTVSSICNPQRDPLNHPQGEGVDEVFESGHLPFAASHQPSHMPTQPVPPRDLIQTLVSLNVADPRSAVKKSLTAGYSLDQIRAIVAWYQAAALTDESGKLVYPYDPGQLVLRLRDRDAIDAEPAQGNWQGGKSGFWTRLAPISTPNPRKQPRQSPQATSPAIRVIRTTYTTALTASEILTALEERHAPATVRQSFDRWKSGGPLPKTIAFWLKANGYAVEEGQQ